MKKKNLHEFLRKNMELAIRDYQMIQEGDRILVAVSGGADSLCLLRLLSGKKIHVTNDISLLAVHLDLGFDAGNDWPLQRLENYFLENGSDYYIERTDIGPFAHSEKNRRNPCFLCSRMRRKRLFEIAREHECNKIAFGHHKDDIIETFLLNIFFSRETSTMLPNQSVFKGMFHIIRPLAYIDERLIKAYARENNLPILRNNCPTSETSKRKWVKDWLNTMEGQYRGIKENIYKAMKKVKLDYLPLPVDNGLRREDTN